MDDYQLIITSNNVEFMDQIECILVLVYIKQLTL